MDSIVSVISGPSRQAQLGVSARSVTPLFGHSQSFQTAANNNWWVGGLVPARRRCRHGGEAAGGGRSTLVADGGWRCGVADDEVGGQFESPGFGRVRGEYPGDHSNGGAAHLAQGLVDCG